MNKIYVNIDFTNETLEKTGIDLISGDYASTEIEFTFDESHSTGKKVFEMKAPSEKIVFVKEIEDNKILLAGKDENENNVSLFDESGYYIFEVSYYENDSKLTSVKGRIPVQQEAVVIGDEIVEPYLPIFDELMQEINTVLTQTDNLNIDGSKSGKITTITITYKDGTTKELQLEDGKSIEYNWQGTSLGIRQEGQSEYVYVDLKGEKGDAGSIKFIIVETLPSENIDESAMYLTPSENPDLKNHYDEWIWVTDRFEPLGKTQIEVDLTDYVKNTDYATYSKGGVVKIDGAYGLEIASGILRGKRKTYAEYENAPLHCVISKATLENVIKGLVSNTDYATSSTGGVIKTSNYYDTEIDSSGALRSKVVSYAGYSNESNNAFISKGTLNNVLTATIGDIQTLLDNLDTGSGV